MIDNRGVCMSSFNMKLVKVTWLDSYGVTNDWEELSAVNPDGGVPVEVVSVGYIKEGKDLICLIPNVSQKHDEAEEQCCGVMTIPRVAIKSIDTLVVGKITLHSEGDTYLGGI